MKISTQLIIVLLSASTSLAGAYADPTAKSSAKTPAKSSGGAKKPAARPASSAKGSGETGGGAGSSAAFNSYANQVRTKMGGNWTYPAGNNHVTLTIQINQDGSVANLSLDSSPKNNEAEQKANDAFNSAQPLQALPSGVTEAKMTAVFDSEADQWSTKGARISVKIDPTKSEAPAHSEAKSSDSAPAASSDSGKTEDKK